MKISFLKLVTLTVPLVGSAVLFGQDLPTYTETFTGGVGEFDTERGLVNDEETNVAWADTNKAGGAAAGEFGGTWNRTDDAGRHLLLDTDIGDVSRLDHLTISGKFFIEENLNYDGWLEIGFKNVALIDANPINGNNYPFVGISIIEPGGEEPFFRVFANSSSILGGATRGSMPEDETQRVPVGQVVTFSFEWIPDQVDLGNGTHSARFDWEGGGYDSTNVEISFPDATEWTFDSFTIGMGAAGSPDLGRQAIVWVDDITYSVETARATESDAVFSNVSTRGSIDGTSSPAQILTPGIVVDGTDPKTVLIRAIGPGLGQFGVTGFCPDPVLTLFDQADTSTPIATNAKWGDAANAAEIATTAATVGGFAVPADSLDAAWLGSLAPGAYTAQASCNGGAGDVLTETYAAD